MPGDALESVVRAAGADDRADRHQLVHLRGDPRQMLADLDARHVGLDRLELAADLGRRVHLQIEHVLVRRPAGQEDHDDRLCASRRMPATALGPQNLRQRQAAQGQPADLQKRSPRQAVAKTVLRLAQDRQHAFRSSVEHSVPTRSALHCGTDKIVSKSLDSFKGFAVFRGSHELFSRSRSEDPKFLRHRHKAPQALPFGRQSAGEQTKSTADPGRIGRGQCFLRTPRPEPHTR